MPDTPADPPVSPPPPGPHAPDGPWELRDEAGTLRQSAGLARGSLHGPLNLFDEQGAPAMQESWRHGTREGIRRIFVDGRLHSVAPYRGSLPHGETVLYHAGGTEAARLPYVAGKLHGEARFFDERGNPARVATYRLGKLHGEARTLYPNGDLLAAEPYVNNLRHGEARWFAPDGTVTRRTVFEHGKPLEPAKPGAAATKPAAPLKPTAPKPAAKPVQFPPPLPKRH